MVATVSFWIGVADVTLSSSIVSRSDFLNLFFPETRQLAVKMLKCEDRPKGLCLKPSMWKNRPEQGQQRQVAAPINHKMRAQMGP